MGGSYAEVWEYREDTGDTSSDDARVEATLIQQSAKLRAVAGIRPGRKLTGDQAAMARPTCPRCPRKTAARGRAPGELQRERVPGFGHFLEPQRLGVLRRVDAQGVQALARRRAAHVLRHAEDRGMTWLLESE